MYASISVDNEYVNVCSMLSIYAISLFRMYKRCHCDTRVSSYLYQLPA